MSRLSPTNAEGLVGKIESEDISDVFTLDTTSTDDGVAKDFIVVFEVTTEVDRA